MAKQVGALGPTGVRVAQRLRDLRTDADLTLQALATRLVELGRPIDLSALAKIEKGQRRIDVDDLIALALALDVSPNWLLLPSSVRDDMPVELTSSHRNNGIEVWTWALRDRPRQSGATDDDLRMPDDVKSIGSNFEFLRSDWPEIFAAAVRAEQLAKTEPRMSCVYARSTLELVIAWIYQIDGSIRLPDRVSLATMIAAPVLAGALGPTVVQKMNRIRSQGNTAVHGRGRIPENEAIQVVSELFDVTLWIARTYSPNLEDLPDSDAVFDPGMIPSQDPAGSIVGDSLTAPAEIATTAPESPTATFEGRMENETLELVVKLLLEEAGWSSAQSTTRNYRIDTPSLPTSAGMVADYVLWDDDGKPLAVVEITALPHDHAPHIRQAQIYADLLERQFHQRPIIFCTNGDITYIWDDVRHAPREIQGFYTKEELRRLVRRHKIYQPLADIQVNDRLVNRHYQLRAIRRTCEAFEEDGQRRALLSMAQGSGKGMVAMALVDLLMRAGRVHRVLYLSDRALMVQQIVHMFNTHLPEIPVASRLREDYLSGRIQVATYQTMLALMNDSDESGLRKFGPGYFDLIIIGEAASGYRQYRAIVEHFDSLVLGFTSSPKDTLGSDVYELFRLDNDAPTESYSLTEAISEGYAIAPTFFEIQLTADPHVNDVSGFLFSSHAIDNMLEVLMRDGVRASDGVSVGKTIIFAKSIRHAQLISERFRHRYPQLDHDFSRSITYSDLDSRQMISRFSTSDQTPQIAISAGLLDTGLDIPAVVNLVFFKPVRSKSLFWQMLAQGARIAPDLFGPQRDKTTFHVFDYCRNLDFTRVVDVP